MSGGWGPDGPPDEAYSRVTRDLRAVFARFVALLEGAPGELTTAFDAVARPATSGEMARLVRCQQYFPVTDAVALVPAAAGASPLILGRWYAADDGVTGGVVAFGELLVSPFPGCWCDACDTDSAEAIDDLERYLEAVTRGFTEYRKSSMLGWFCHGVGGESHGGDEGPDFSIDWAPWSRR